VPMILLVAVILGLLVALGRARFNGWMLRSPQLRVPALVMLAFVPQGVAFYLPATRELLTAAQLSHILVLSQLLLLLFALINLDQAGFRMLSLGVGLNLLVITLNGGMMPISPETVMRLAPHASPDAWQVGERLGTSKDVVLPVGSTRLWWLSDHFVLPVGLHRRVAFSLGDIFLAVGAFRFLTMLGGMSSWTDKTRRLTWLTS
jgi:hypothetical protein